MLLRTIPGMIPQPPFPREGKPGCTAGMSAMTGNATEGSQPRIVALGGSGWRWETLPSPEWEAAIGGGVSLLWVGGGLRVLLSRATATLTSCCEQEGGQRVSQGPFQQSGCACVILHGSAPGTAEGADGLLPSCKTTSCSMGSRFLQQKRERMMKVSWEMTETCLQFSFLSPERYFAGKQ